MKTPIFILSLFTLIACSSQKNENTKSPVFNTNSDAAIINGTKITSENKLSPFTVGLFDKNSGLTCTGMLIKNNVVLTAAHCIDIPVSELMIAFNVGFSSEADPKPVVYRQATSVKIHDHREPNNLDDLALVKFEGELPSGYHPAEFLKDASLLKIGALTQTAGYGATGLKATPVTENDPNFNEDFNNGWIRCENMDTKTDCFRVELSRDNPETLRMAEAKIVQFHKDAFMTLTENNQTTCTGDSGGPATITVEGTPYIVGITKAGDALCKRYTVFVNALLYQNWIQQAEAGMK
jgi:secreted trypsin-like serine protease